METVEVGEPGGLEAAGSDVSLLRFGDRYSGTVAIIISGAGLKALVRRRHKWSK